MSLEVLEILRYSIGAIAYIAILGYSVRGLKKNVNGLGTKLRKVELSLARIEGAMGLHSPKDNHDRS